jgi:hypothetical protein
VRRILLILLTLACVVVLVTPASATDPDFGLPDSVFFKAPTVELVNCSREVRVTLPLYLWTDGLAQTYGLTLYWRGATSCDTAFLHPLRPCSDCDTTVLIDDSAKSCAAGLFCNTEYITPGHGVICEYVLTSHLGDTIVVWPQAMELVIGNGILWWYPTYMNLDTSFVLPDTLAAKTGDADCSGSVDISDAVFLITYIFAGGIPPYDRNAADENGDCAVDISDAVYLIAYIFSGGPASQAGCVVP